MKLERKKERKKERMLTRRKQKGGKDKRTICSPEKLPVNPINLQMGFVDWLWRKDNQFSFESFLIRFNLVWFGMLGFMAYQSL